MTRAELIEELTRVQNLAKNQGRDIMTIAAMMDNEQLAAHIERNRSQPEENTMNNPKRLTVGA